MDNYNELITELNEKIEHGDNGEKKAGDVSVTDWSKIGNKLIERFEDYPTKVKRLEAQKKVKDLKGEAQQVIENFSNFVDSLSANNLYTDDAKKSLYKEQYKQSEAKLKSIGNEQCQLLNETVELSQNNAKKAYEDLKHNAKTSDLTPQDFNYIELVLKRDNSPKARQKIAEKYNYHFVVLDILNAGVPTVGGEEAFINHPLDYMAKGLPRYGMGFQDVFLEQGGVYIREVLKPLNNKLFSGSIRDGHHGLF